MRLPYTPQATPLWNPPHIYATLQRRSQTQTQAQTSSNSAPHPQKPPQLLALDRALAHSPPLLTGWSALLGALRDAAALPPAPFELAACRVAALNGASFEWAQHAPLLERALRARGAHPAAVLAAVRAVREALPGTFAGRAAAATAGPGAAGEGAVDGLGAADTAVLALADCMTRAPAESVPEEVWARVRAAFPREREVVELVAAVAAYNMVSRVLVTLDVGEAGPWDERLRGVDGAGAGARAKL